MHSGGIMFNWGGRTPTLSEAKTWLDLYQSGYGSGDKDWGSIVADLEATVAKLSGQTPAIRARPTLEEIQCPADQYAGWDGDPNHPAVCIPYDVVGVPAIPGIPTPPLAPAPGTTSKCPRGQAYDKPFFGLGGCDPGYVSSSGAFVQGMGAQCICAETPEGRQVTQTPAEGEYQPDDLGLGGLMKMLPQLIMVLVVVQIIGAFRK